MPETCALSALSRGGRPLEPPLA